MARLLLVDDEIGGAELLRSFFTKLGYDVALALTGAQALLAAARCAPAVLVTDFVLPDMSGADLARTLREHAPKLPVIIVSGLHPDEVRERCIDLTDVHIRAKPLALEELMHLVARATA